MDIEICPFHTIYNGFSKGIRVIYFDIEHFIVDLNSFVKFSSARKEEAGRNYWAPTAFSLKHSFARLVTMKKVTVRILEQWENVAEDFLKFLPKQSNFKMKRYQRIKEYPEHSLTRPNLFFITFMRFWIIFGPIWKWCTFDSFPVSKFTY